MRLLWGKALLFFAVILCLAPFPVHGQEPEKVFNAVSHRLDNGLQIIVIPNHRAPVVTHMIWYKIGAADEPQGKSGIAHYLEHLLFKGTDNLAPGEFSETVRGLGGQDNAFTSQDYTAYFQSIAVEHLETVMRMEADRMRNLKLLPEDIISERKVILEERRQRTDNDPRSQFQELISSALYPDHPYGIPVIGWMDEMEKLNREDAFTFYSQYYTPSNAILVVSGDVTGEQVFEIAQRTYGSIPPTGLVARMRTAVPPEQSKKHIVFEHKSIRQAMVQMAFRVPSYSQNKDESLALQVLEEIAGNGPTTRLYKSLVVEQKIASGAGIQYRADALNDSTFWIYAYPVPGVQPDDVLEALKNEIQKLAEHGVTDEELKDASSRMQNAATYARDSLNGPPMAFGVALTTGSRIDDVEYWPHYISEVTAERIQAAAQKFLDTTRPGAQHPVTGYLLPKEGKQE